MEKGRGMGGGGGGGGGRDTYPTILILMYKAF